MPAEAWRRDAYGVDGCVWKRVSWAPDTKRGGRTLERLKVKVDLLLLALVGEDRSAVDDETVGRRAVVELQTLLGGGNGSEHGESVDAGLDVRGC